MIKNISIGQYVPSDSFVHNLDPRTKIILSLFYIICIFLIKSFFGYLVIFSFTLFIIYISKLKPIYIYKGLRPILVLVLITALLNIFMVKGNVLLFKYSFFEIYKEGLIMAAFMIIRLTFLVIGTSILTLTTSPIQLTDGIEKLLKPIKVIGLSAHELAMMMTIALRFIPTLMDETDKIMKAQMARGADFESGNLIKRSKALIPILVPLFISSFRRADELAMAMEARCYRGGSGRTRMKVLRFNNSDYLSCIVSLLFFMISIFIN
ncbi:MAG: energy-coupling factor transporter transmembrane protein EcfT [Clostridiaceae bacterium]